MVSVNLFLGERECNRCHDVLPLDEDHFYRLPSGSFRGHCKSCHNRDTMQNRRDRQAGIRPRQDRCECCGTRTKFTVRDLQDRPFCEQCFGWVSWVQSSGYDLQGVMAAIKHNEDHCRWVEERRAGHHSNKAFIAHPDWNIQPQHITAFTAPDHRDCPAIGARLRAVLSWAVRTRSAADVPAPGV